MTNSTKSPTSSGTFHLCLVMK